MDRKIAANKQAFQQLLPLQKEIVARRTKRDEEMRKRDNEMRFLLAKRNGRMQRVPGKKKQKRNATTPRTKQTAVNPRQGKASSGAAIRTKLVLSVKE